MNQVKTESESLGLLDSSSNRCPDIRPSTELVAFICVLEQTKTFGPPCNTQAHREALFFLLHECSAALLLDSLLCANA